jgi:hypothetical protein
MKIRSLNATFKNKIEHLEDGGVIVKDVPLLAEGVWTDSAVQTPLYYPERTLKKFADNWVLRSIWSRHSGGNPRSVTDKVGEVENIRFDESTKSVMGDLKYHCLTQASKDCAALVEGGFINAVSVEHGGSESFNREAGRYEAEELSFYGLAMVDKGACEKCVIHANESNTESSDSTPSGKGGASEGGKQSMDEEIANKFAELEARLAALEGLKEESKDAEGEEPKEMAELKEAVKKMASYEATVKELGDKIKALELTPVKRSVIENADAEKLEFI